MSPPTAIAPPEARRLSRVEFIAMIGTVFATVAFSIDAMLPALPQIAAELSPEDANRAQLILTSFVLGMGFGTLVAGPLSDALGRKPVIVLGAAVYFLGAGVALIGNSLEMVLLGRVIQGVGAAGPRVVTLAMVRDLFTGRVMAQIISYAMIVFTLFPAVAPLIGAAIIAGFGWRAIFWAFLIFSVVTASWMLIRQPETLPVAARRPLRARALMADMREAMAHRQMQLSILVQSCVFTALFGAISSVQPVFDVSFGRAEAFPLWFAAIALMAAPSGPINGILVVRLGMRPMIRRALWATSALSLGAGVGLMAMGTGDLAFALFVVWTVSIFATASFTIGNLNALALEPLGHIAGSATSLMGAISTVAGAVGGALIGQLFDGTAVPVSLAVAGVLAVGAVIMLRMPREAVDG